MGVVVQRVTASSVTVAAEALGQIGQGLQRLVAIALTDTTAELTWMARQCPGPVSIPG